MPNEAAPRTEVSPTEVSPTEVSPTEILWDSLAKPVDPWGAAEALVGLTPGGARLLAAVLLVSSPQAEVLLRTMPSLSRSLSLSTVSRSERSSGEIRGPILWSETMAARAATSGDPTTFVFAIASRAYDTAENRVLVNALDALGRAGKTVDLRALRQRNSGLATIVAERSMSAQRWLDHRALVDVSRRATRRDRQRTKAGVRQRSYRVALDLLDRHAVPLTGDELGAVADIRTLAQHRGLVALVDGLRQRGVEPGALHVREGTLVAGPVRYVNERSRPARSGSAAGIFIGSHAVDVPAVADVPAILDAAGF